LWLYVTDLFDHNFSHLVVCVCAMRSALCLAGTVLKVPFCEKRHNCLRSAWPALCVFLTEIAKMDVFVHRLFSVIAVSCKLPLVHSSKSAVLRETAQLSHQCEAVVPLSMHILREIAQSFHDRSMFYEYSSRNSAIVVVLRDTVQL
jgi:hypothetical protein